MLWCVSLSASYVRKINLFIKCVFNSSVNSIKVVNTEISICYIETTPPPPPPPKKKKCTFFKDYRFVRLWRTIHSDNGDYWLNNCEKREKYMN